MKTGLRAGVVAMVAMIVGMAMAVACSSSSGGGSPGDGGSGVTYSCTLPGFLCTQILGPPSAMSGEQQACAMQMGMFAVAPCPSAGSFGCCLDQNGIEEQCVYSTAPGVPNQSSCTQQGKTWIGPDGGTTSGDGGATGAAAFVGTWARSGTNTVMCPNGTTTTMLMGNLVITLASTSDTISATAPNGCTTDYSVSGNVATAAPGQMCSVTTEGGIAETITVQSHTLTLSADGLSLTSMGTDAIDKTATMTMCTSTFSGTFTKQ